MMVAHGRATRALLGRRPTCDICRENHAIVDGATHRGWAYMCQADFDEHGRGLGIGVGQVLLCGDSMDAKLIRKYDIVMEA